jgi:uracil-DNA glycosylase
MLIGQAPGRREIEIGLPFAGDAGKRLVGWLGLAGIGVGEFRDEWYVTSVGKCYPGRAAGSSVDKPPSQAEVALWGPYLVEELRLVDPQLVLLIGGLAHRFAFGTGARLDNLVGRELTWADARHASVICLPHPSGASTWLNDPEHVELWRRGIDLVKRRWDDLSR